MKTFIKILLVLCAIIFAVVAYIQFTWNKEYEAPFPEIKASTDSAVIARGKYLAYGPAHCGTCHVPMNKIMDVENGEIIPLSGGWTIDIPPGTFHAPNITPDEETGIGRFSDGELARVLRHMVGKDGRCIFPFMPFAELSDDDLTAVISYLRSQPPVKNNVPKSELKFLGKMLSSFGLVKPEGTKGNPPKSVAIDSTVEYGKYLANYVANCVGCHTNRDMKTGEFIGVPFAGGFAMPPDPYFSEGFNFVTPNLTPDPETGIMASWSEETFVYRFLKTKRLHKGTPMPWGSFSRINELELKAIYRYLKTLDPVKNHIPKTVYAPGEVLPES
jgi:mono/diheme cytochrome c family protein